MAPFIDRPEVIKVGPMVVGVYGGRSAAGAVRNDGIGDCVAFALHADLMALGQYALNQRAFYEWFGPGGAIVSLASGIHALREGRTRIMVATQGALRHIDLAEMAQAPRSTGSRS